MRSVLLFIVGAAVGAMATFFVAGGVLLGVGAGAGIATGVKAGACLTADAAKEKGYITPEQVSELLAAAGTQISGQTPSVDATFRDGDAGCQKIIADLKQAAQKSN